MAGNGTVLNLGRTLADVHHPGDPGLLRLRGPTRHTPSTTGPQSQLELRAQLAPGLQEQCLVNGLVTHTQSPVIGNSANNLPETCCGERSSSNFSAKRSCKRRSDSNFRCFGHDFRASKRS